MFHLIQQFLAPAQPARQPVSVQPARMPLPEESGKKQFYNPFMSAMSQDSAEFRSAYGVNRPLAKPMFLGYRDDKALYGGSRLFILY